MTTVLRSARRQHVGPWAAALLAGAVAALLVIWSMPHFGLGVRGGKSASAPIPWAYRLDGQPAPNFTLTDQFGQSRSLRSYRGKEVVLAFVDAQCTAVCPLTAEILRNARNRLGSSAAGRLSLVAVNANPVATSVHTTYQWSREHGMLHQWTFLTGSASHLRRVYTAYRVYDTVDSKGNVTHDAAIILIDVRGHERLYYNTDATKAHPTVLSEEAAYAKGMQQVLH